MTGGILSSMQPMTIGQCSTIPTRGYTFRNNTSKLASLQRKGNQNKRMDPLSLPFIHSCKYHIIFFYNPYLEYIG